MMNSELQGKVALVTGASRGIGKSIALELAAAGYDLLLTARDSAALDGVAAVVRATGRRSEIHAADLRGEGEPARLASLARERFGRLDVLINNAGASRRGSFFEQTEAEWQDGFARYHQRWLTWKNSAEKTGSNFIPMIKVLKHLRSVFAVDAVSFHLESLLFNAPDEVFRGAPVDYIPSVLSAITAASAEAAWIAGCMTPCRDRDVLSEPEWGLSRWRIFHELAKKWTMVAQRAAGASSRADAIALWRLLLGDAYFPETVTR